MPFENEHACRLKPPNYERYARKNCEEKHDGKCIDVIYGIKDGKSEIQSLRYPKKSWTAAAAKSHCGSRNGTFEAARESAARLIAVKDRTGRMDPIRVTDELFQALIRQNADENGNMRDEIVVFAESVFEKSEKDYLWVLSDMTVDRDAEQIDPAGWDLKNYKRNPVVIWSHDYKTPAIGTMSSIRVKEGKLRGQVRFDPPEVDAFAGMIANKVRLGTIRAGSVGFIPKRIELVTDKDDPSDLVYREQELYEFSICNVPANPNALIEGDKSQERFFADLSGLVDRMGDMVEAVKVFSAGPRRTDNYIQDLFSVPQTTERQPTDQGIDHLLSRKSSTEGKDVDGN